MAWYSDAETGEQVVIAHVPIEQQRVHYANNPPTCLADLRSTAAELPGHRFDGHGEPVNAVFAVACPCGTDVFVPLAALDDDNCLQPPYSLECTACDEIWEVFDPARHGWDGVLDPIPRKTWHGIGELGDELQIYARFECSSEVLGHPDMPQSRGREPDLFTWFTLVGRDPETGTLTTLAEWECA